MLGFAIWTHVQSGSGVPPGPVEVRAFLLMVAAAWAVRDGHPGWGFAATTAAIAATVVAMFVHLYPNVMVSSTNSAYNLTVENSAVEPLRPHGDDRGGGHLRPARHRLPGLELPRLPGRIKGPAAQATPAVQPSADR